MLQRKANDITPQEVQHLRSVRRQLEVVRRARLHSIQVEADIISVRSPGFDGQPYGNSTPHGLEDRISRSEAAKLRLARETAKLTQLESKAFRVIESLSPNALHDFCYYYYLKGHTIKKAAELIDRSEGTCKRYKHAIEQNTALSGAVPAGQKKRKPIRQLRHP